MVDCKPCAAPISLKLHISSDFSLPYPKSSLYRSLTITRPELSYAVNQACQHMHSPTIAHFSTVKLILRYVKGTLHFGLQFHPSQFHLHAHSDSNWAGDSTDRRSTSGYCVYLGTNLISWSSKKQATISRSSTKTEYRSLAHTAAELSWLQMLLIEFSILHSTSSTLSCDNLSSMSLATNPVFHSRSKHIEVDCHFVHERVASNKLLLKYVPSADQVADVFTNPSLLLGFPFSLTSSWFLQLPLACGGMIGSSSYYVGVHHI
ncbi:uncharacterized protein LOC114292119 [Camellia sinensis]|uniref:uncharacterized protein LOC114292119 n=1 Tax=Camellia sinensis TaxID=4442 RepID=UPI001035EE5C|nr:uncharacterized protein LOC114292119 [Camellia sinensis]